MLSCLSPALFTLNDAAFSRKPPLFTAAPALAESIQPMLLHIRVSCQILSNPRGRALSGAQGPGHMPQIPSATFEEDQHIRCSWGTIIPFPLYPHTHLQGTEKMEARNFMSILNPLKKLAQVDINITQLPKTNPHPTEIHSPTCHFASFPLP